MLTRILSAIPVSVLRAIGRPIIRLKFIGPIIYSLACRYVAGEGIIRHGVGAGLRFDATGGIPGYLLGTSDEPEQNALKSLLGRGQVFYDIGANIGFYSTMAARIVGPEGHVYAFEPFPASAISIRRNACLNGFEDIVSVIEQIVLAECGTAHLVLGAISPYHHVGATGMEIAAISIDEFTKEHRPPDVVMIDVEGVELEVLRGMRGTLERHRPSILCEVHSLGTAFTDYFRLHLEPLGYTLTGLDGNAPPSGRVRYHAVMLSSATPMNVRT
jgi:FkbM family methyltransferase